MQFIPLILDFISFSGKSIFLSNSISNEFNIYYQTKYIQKYSFTDIPTVNVKYSNASLDRKKTQYTKVLFKNSFSSHNETNRKVIYFTYSILNRFLFNDALQYLKLKIEVTVKEYFSEYFA